MGKAQRERAQSLSEHLAEMEACPDAVKWVGNRSLPRAWRECERPGWMLWLCDRMAGEHGWPTRDDVWRTADDAAKHGVYTQMCNVIRARLKPGRMGAQGDADPCARTDSEIVGGLLPEHQVEGELANE